MDQKRRTYSNRDFDRSSAYQPIVTPLFKPVAPVPRRTKYTYCVPVITDTQSEKETQNVTKKTIRSRKIEEKPEKTLKTFKDLFQYENFHDYLKPINEESDSEPSEVNTKSCFVKKRYSEMLPSQKYSMPKGEPSVTSQNIEMSSYYMPKSTASFGTSQSKIRRYGRNKYKTGNESEFTDRFSATTDFGRRESHTLNICDSSDEFQTEQRRKEPEPVIKSVVTSLLNRSRHEQEGGRLHEYQIDPMATEYGPGQLESFRDRRNGSSVERDTFRATSEL
mmetsp:Transcript_20491/g.23659  ORF Transcript_20491/g.23659 Transcript_20491/m.23659 type:complete len:278 (+) Transcript_20491:466-1299(+)